MMSFVRFSTAACGAKRTFSLLTILAEGTTIGDGWLAKNEMERILRTSILFQRDHDKGVLTIGIIAFADARPAFICQTHAR